MQRLRQMRWALVSVCSLVVVGCVQRQVVVTDEAETVKVANTSEVERCSFISMVTCHNGGNFQQYEKNLNACLAEARQKTHDQGGTHFVLDDASMNTSQQTVAGAIAGTPTSCQNCVALTGRAYKCESLEDREVCMDMQDDYQACLDRGGYDPMLEEGS